ncbi:hypothetical protein [Candidatus Odyssella thessalonicensis]|uniref:hypothetical protein n=1 Tax=Candidatus Odyssella thessalonicensis TaxID=84647 RepID=UPI0011125D0E|nr:hypothetical protein [Candidatus Odyssella thessalonicensis]
MSPLSSRRLVPVVPRKSLNHTHAIYTPDTVYTVIRFPVDLSRNLWTIPVLMSVLRITTRHQWFIYIRLYDSYLPSLPDFSLTLTTVTLNNSRLRWFEACS